MERYTFKYVDLCNGQVVTVVMLYVCFRLNKHPSTPGKLHCNRRKVVALPRCMSECSLRSMKKWAMFCQMRNES